MKKKWYDLICVIAVCLAVCAFCGCNNRPSAPIVLVDFPATAAEEVTLGSEYRLKIKTVKDENGKEYAVSAIVTDSKGQNVELTNGETFAVTDKDGYVIVYTANTGASPQTQTLTLTVIDAEKPTIVISEPSEGVVGVEYTLPAISFSDISPDKTYIFAVFTIGLSCCEMS